VAAIAARGVRQGGVKLLDGRDGVRNVSDKYQDDWSDWAGGTELSPDVTTYFSITVAALSHLQAACFYSQNQLSLDSNEISKNKDKWI